MKVGFTGTRKGMSQYQKHRVYTYLERLGASEAHHGDCVGADSDFHDICLDLGIDIYIHPGRPNHRAWKGGAYCYYDAKDYFERNKDIVDTTDTLLATPDSDKERVRSGTWATIRYAKKCDKTVLEIYP